MKIPYNDKFLNLKTAKAPLIIKMQESNTEYRFNLNDFRNFANKIDNLLIIVNDASRNTPTYKIIGFVDKIIESIKKVKFIIATGTHPATNREEKIKIFGKYFYKYEKKIIDHDGITGKYNFYGETSFKTRVFYNKILKEFSNILVIGGVEPHYFAGFSGGRKSIFPGIAAYQSIENNHKLALKTSSKILSLEDNPVNLDMIEAVSFLDKNIYSIQIINDQEGNIKFLSQGNLKESFGKAVEFAKKYFTVEVENKVDLLLAVVEPPFDRNFYQAHKGLENTKGILNENGTMILIAKCEKGIGNRNFYDLLKKVSKIQDYKNYIEKNYKLGFHKTAKILDFLSNRNLILISDLDKKLFTGTNIQAENNLQKVYNRLEKKYQKVAIVYNAAIVVPILKKDGKVRF